MVWRAHRVSLNAVAVVALALVLATASLAQQTRTEWTQATVVDLCVLPGGVRCDSTNRSLIRTQFDVAPLPAHDVLAGSTGNTFLMQGFYLAGGLKQDNTGKFVPADQDDIWSLWMNPSNDANLRRYYNPKPLSLVYWYAQGTVSVLYPSSTISPNSSSLAIIMGGAQNSSAGYAPLPSGFSYTRPEVTPPNFYVYKYDPIPNTRSRHSAVSADNTTVVLFGGIVSSDTVSNEYVLSDSVLIAEMKSDLYYLNYTRYNSSMTSGSWPSVRMDHAAIMVNGTMIVHGGLNGLGYLNDTWFYDVKTNTWTQPNITILAAPGNNSIFPSENSTSSELATMLPRGGHKLVALWDKYRNRTVVLMFGGMGPSGYLNDTWELDLAAMTWQPFIGRGITPPARAYYGLAQLDDHRFVIFGGDNGTHILADHFTFNYWARDGYPATVEYVSRATNTWIAIGAAVILVILVIVVIILKVAEKRV